MARFPTLAAVAALGLGASGCAVNNEPLSPANNPSAYSVHQPVVQRTDFVIDLSTSGDRVAPSELQRLNAWFDSIGIAYGDRISIDEPSGYESAAARADVASVAAARGLLLSDGAPVLNGTVQPGTIRVVASRTVASVPNCPNWDEDTAEPTVNTSSNYGCAINTNVAAMIANPEDLLRGQDGSGTGNADTAGRAIRVYRARQPSGSGNLPATGGSN